MLPAFVNDFRAQQFAYVGIYLIALIGLNILTGYTGQISLGHGAFMAIGGYTTAILMVDHGVKDVWTIPIAAVVAGIAGFLFGIPALRLSGLYLALATFAIAVATPAVIKRFEGFTGGGSGINLFGTPELTASLDAGRRSSARSSSSTTGSTTCAWTVALVALRGRLAAPARADGARASAPCATARRRRVVGRQPAALQDARVRRQRRLRGRRRGAVRDRDDLRQPGHVPDRALDLPARRRRRRRARLARRA